MTKTLNNSKKSTEKRVEDLIIRRFLSDLLRKNLSKHSTDEYNHNLINDISDSLVRLTLNIVINTAIKHAVKKSYLKQKCFNCSRADHNSYKCL